MGFKDQRNWNACWISFPACQIDWRAEISPAPFFRSSFISRPGSQHKIAISGLGYYELFLNGLRVGDRELDPEPGSYLEHVGYTEYDVTTMVKPGQNTIGVVLGNGWYNCSTAEVWHLDKAVWRDNPKLIAEVTADGKTLLGSNDAWKVFCDGPIRFDALREGEIYDARKELPGWCENHFDDTAWPSAVIVPGPGGELFRQTAPPCRVMGVAPMRPLRGKLYDAGVNLAGRALLKVHGKAGATVTLRYGDVLNAAGDELDVTMIGRFVGKEHFQTEKYTLRGDPTGEVWHSHFTYHGFRYVEVTVEGEAEVKGLFAQKIHSDLKPIGSFHCSSATMNGLEQCTMHSFVNNFVGMPTDCPQREKHGWANDTQLASETGLWHFELGEAYRQWLGCLRDTQRNSGQLPGMAPTSGWGYNWGNGPLCDSALLIIPRNIYIYRGDDAAMAENYAAFKLYLDFLKGLSPSGILKYGLGDWKHYQMDRMVEPSLVSTALYYADLEMFAEVADHFGRASDAAAARERAAFILDAWRRKFTNPDGTFAKGEKTADGVALYTRVCPDGLRQKTAARLDAAMRHDRCIADFGIVGAKTIPRVLAQSGFADTAFETYIQPQFPGWAKWFNDGETTLLEDFAGEDSHDHIMFGDLSAWMFEFAGGLRPSLQRAGFAAIELAPVFPKQLDSFRMAYSTVYGKVAVEWKRDGGKIAYRASTPAGRPARITLPDGTQRDFDGSISVEIQ
ncbi:MAG: family 78 glycoside hydrolase catalytic domain [Victivallaceae bacterium]|nr:family 78 glycoside hydrolase catalytic domain [Victivallaceae bacterium]